MEKERKELWEDIKGADWADLVEEEEKTNPPSPPDQEEGWSVVQKRVEKKKIAPVSFPKLRENNDIISANKAFELQKTLQIDLLGKTLLSKRAIDIQKRGYIYTSILTPQNKFHFQVLPGEAYMTLEVPNKYRDKILFVRKVKVRC